MVKKMTRTRRYEAALKELLAAHEKLLTRTGVSPDVVAEVIHAREALSPKKAAGKRAELVSTLLEVKSELEEPGSQVSDVKVLTTKLNKLIENYSRPVVGGRKAKPVPSSKEQ